MELKNVYYPNLNGHVGFEMLFAFFMASSVFMVIMIFLGIACQLNLKVSLEMLESLVQSSEWNIVYGNEYSLSTIQMLTKCFFQICSISCMIIAVGLFYIFTRAIKIGESQLTNRLTAFFLTFNNVLFPLITMLFLYFTLMAKD